MEEHTSCMDRICLSEPLIALFMYVLNKSIKINESVATYGEKKSLKLKSVKKKKQKHHQLHCNCTNMKKKIKISRRQSTHIKKMYILHFIIHKNKQFNPSLLKIKKKYITAQMNIIIGKISQKKI